MDILYSTSDSYAFLTGISILSLLENNKNVDNINIYIMDNNISEKNKNKLIKTVLDFDRKIFFVEMPSIKNMTGRDVDTGRWNISTFGRLFMASALPESVHKVINIDCDTIIVDSLQEMWETDLSNYVVGGILECINNRYKRNVGIETGNYYFNGGVVFLNLDSVREMHYEEKFIDYITQYGSSLAYLDQDVLNGVIPQEKKKSLPLKFDVLSIYYYTNYEELLKIRRSKDFYEKAEFQDAVKKPAIVHFTTCFLDGLRPWMDGNMHPLRNEFLKYKKMSLWRDEPMWTDKRSGLVKFRTKLIKMVPMLMLCELASLLHGVVVPNRNYRRMKKEVE